MNKTQKFEKPQFEDDIKTGDIGLSINDSFLAKGIRFFMNVYRRVKGLPKRQLFNHSFHFVWLEGELFVAEAIAKGGVLRPYRGAYLKKHIRHMVKTPIDPYTDEEKKELKRFTITFIGQNHEYQFLNFPIQILYVISGGRWWIGRKGKKSRERVYCTETTAICINSVRETWERPWAANPLDIDLAPEYKDSIDLT